jgi:hypothetical protein
MIMVYAPPPADCCSITLTSFNELRRENRLVRTPCNHYFDRVAIHDWIERQKKSTCPLCQRHITVLDIRSEPCDGILSRIGRFICSFFEFIWKGIIFLCEVSVEEERYASRRQTTVVYGGNYVSAHSREPARREVRPPYVPQAASRASVSRDSSYAASACDFSGGRAPLGMRVEEYKPGTSGSSSRQGGRVPLGTRT